MKKVLFLFLFLLPACAMKHQQLGPPVQDPVLTEDAFVAADGKPHALTRWAPEGEPFAVILALHGFNDYRMAFDLPGEYLAENGVLVMAFDQRGFGGDEKAGFWAKRWALKSDVLALLGLIRTENPGVPVFVMGESMGGAVGLFSLSGESAAADGLILVAPAVWGWRPINIVYRPAIFVAAHILPWKKFSGKNLNLMPSDNIGIMKNMAKDPNVIKKTRLDAIYGLSRVMKYAIKRAPEIEIPVYLLYGEEEQLVPDKNLARLWEKLPEGLKTRKIYDRGFHLLLRDCQAGVVWRDILAYVAASAGFQGTFTNPPVDLCRGD